MPLGVREGREIARETLSYGDRWLTIEVWSFSPINFAKTTTATRNHTHRLYLHPPFLRLPRLMSLPLSSSTPTLALHLPATGYGGTPMVIERPGHASGNERFAAAKLIPFLGDETRKERRIKVTFNADCSDALPWKFTPLQKEVRVRPGESALAFYTAKNNSKKDIIGIATYNVTPNNVAPYFAKVECFCFEEQKLLAGEEVDLPILFFIDRDFVDDPSMRDVDDVVLSYTFL